MPMFRGVALIALAVFVGFASAQDPVAIQTDVSSAPSDTNKCKSVLDIIDGLDFLSTFKRAVEITGLGDAFERTNLQATLLVPTDGAFSSAAEEAGIDAANFLQNPLGLQRIVQNHVLPGRVELSDLQDTPVLYGTMDFGNFVKLSTSNNELYVEAEGSNAASKGTEILYSPCSNVKLYVINRVLIPTELSVAEAFKSDDPAPPAGLFGGLFGGGSRRFGPMATGPTSTATGPMAAFPTFGAPGAGTTPGGFGPFSGAAGAGPATATAGFRPFSAFGAGPAAATAAGEAGASTPSGDAAVAAAPRGFFGGFTGPFGARAPGTGAAGAVMPGFTLPAAGPGGAPAAGPGGFGTLFPAFGAGGAGSATAPAASGTGALGSFFARPATATSAAATSAAVVPPAAVAPAST